MFALFVKIVADQLDVIVDLNFTYQMILHLLDFDFGKFVANFTRIL